MSEFSFIILTDSHVTVQADVKGIWWNHILRGRSCEILSVAVEDSNAMKPDFVVHCGDVTDVSDTPSFRAAGEILRRLNCPLHYTPGNHDTYVEGSRDQASAFMGVDGPPFNRTIKYKGWRLLFVDTAYWKYEDGSVHEYFDPDRYDDMYIPDAQIERLREELDEDCQTPTLCFTHVPLALRDAYPGGSLPDEELVDQIPIEYLVGELCLNPKLKAVLIDHPCVKAVFSGHGHWHDCIVEGGTLFCQTGALVEYPNELRRVCVSSDRIEVQAVPLSQGGFAELSYRSQGGNNWTAGRPQDRYYSHALSAPC